MPSFIKMRVVAELATRFRKMRHAILVDFSGLSAGRASALRGALEARGARMLVVKNSLAILALRQLEQLDVAELVDGPTAFIYGGDDPAALAMMVLDWGKKDELLAPRGGMLDGAALGPSRVADLAGLPPLPVLRAQVAGAIASPLTALLGVLQAIPRSLVGVLQAIVDKGQHDAGVPAEGA